ncbi:MAG: cell division protein ZapA [Deltaproteobacteria bacterium]|nr:MAG: cell division protein ZapA [Deltaproteobacteria bacterium]
MIRQVKVSILGQEYTIHTRADKEYVEKVAKHVASKCQEAKDSLRSSSLVTIAILAALNIANDYLQMKEAYEHLLAKIESKHEKLATLIP